MVRWYYRSLFDELEDMRNYLESLSRQMYDPGPVALLPGSCNSAVRGLPAPRSAFSVEVSESDDEVVVSADMIPGVLKMDISLDLLNPQALEISCERREERKEGEEGFYLHKRSTGSMTRIVPLPKPVTGDGSYASLKNGMLAVHLKKTTIQSPKKIPIN